MTIAAIAATITLGSNPHDTGGESAIRRCYLGYRGLVSIGISLGFLKTINRGQIVLVDQNNSY